MNKILKNMHVMKEYINIYAFFILLFLNLSKPQIPDEFLGDIRLSYNLELSFNFRDPYQQPPTPHDIIIEAGNGNKAAIPFSGQNNPVPSSASQSYRFKLNEHPIYDWRVEGDFFAILYDVQAIKIRGKLRFFCYIYTLSSLSSPCLTHPGIRAARDRKKIFFWVCFFIDCK